jgi:hypothetical protein
MIAMVFMVITVVVLLMVAYIGTSEKRRKPPFGAKGSVGRR